MLDAPGAGAAGLLAESLAAGVAELEELAAMAAAAACFCCRSLIIN